MKLLICQPRLIRERGKAVVNNSTRNMKVTTTGGRVQKKMKTPNGLNTVMLVLSEED